MKKLIFTLLLTLPFLTIHSQDTINVPGDYSTIQAAIDAAVNGDIVLVAEDTYYENINFKGKAITIASHFLIDGNETHIENTVINGSQPTDPDSASVVTFRNGEDTNSVICGFTITGGTGTIILYNGLLRRFGGGVFAYYSDAKILHNIIESNYIQYTSDSFGGGICGFDGNYIIESNIIRDNEINTPSIVYYSLGGGVYTYSLVGYVRIVNNKILNNTITAPEAWGGGIIPAGQGNDNYFIINNLISGNTLNATTGGSGGIDIYNHSPTVINNVIVNNSAPTRGGGAVIENATPIFSNNTIAYNTSTVRGGGLDVVGPIPQIMNCILWGNSAPAGSQINGTVNISYSDIEGGYTGTGNIDLDPLFRDALNNDFHLMSTDCGDNFNSPCIDAGNPAYKDSVMDCDWGLGSQDTCDMGAYSIAVLYTGISEENEILPDKYELSQNYPNPFNPVTTIKYQIPERGFVMLIVYDVLGKEIATLANEEKTVGIHQVEFDASSLSSGVYFYRLRSGSFVETKKMLLMK